jgi:hypothetical protein
MLILARKEKTLGEPTHPIRARMAVEVQTCGSPLHSHNPFYHERFITAYQHWLRQKLTPSCVSACMPLVDTTDSTTQLTPAAWSTCVTCLGTTPNVAPLDTALPDPRHGGGCKLCVEVVAPWALHHLGGPSQLELFQDPIPMPTGETLRTFVESGETYRAAQQAWYTLTPCQRAQWIQRVCGQGGERGESYNVISTQAKDDPTSSRSVTQESWFAPLIVVCVLVVGAFVYFTLRTLRSNTVRPQPTFFNEDDATPLNEIPEDSDNNEADVTPESKPESPREVYSTNPTLNEIHTMINALNRDSMLHNYTDVKCMKEFSELCDYIVSNYSSIPSSSRPTVNRLLREMYTDLPCYSKLESIYTTTADALHKSDAQLGSEHR